MQAASRQIKIESRFIKSLCTFCTEDMQRYGYTVAQYLDDLVSEENSKRIEAAEHLPDVWAALGREKTKTGLVPFLAGSLASREIIAEGTTEFLSVVAGHLRQLVLYLGVENGKMILPVVFILFSSEDSVIREQTMASFELICRDCGIKDEELLKFCRKLADDTCFTAKMSAAVIICKLCKCNASVTSDRTAPNEGNYSAIESAGPQPGCSSPCQLGCEPEGRRE